jgi:hypothetical protein
MWESRYCLRGLLKKYKSWDILSKHLRSWNTTKGQKAMHHDEIELNFDSSSQQILGLESEILWEARSTPTLVSWSVANTKSVKFPGCLPVNGIVLNVPIYHRAGKPVSQYLPACPNTRRGWIIWTLTQLSDLQNDGKLFGPTRRHSDVKKDLWL